MNGSLFVNTAAKVTFELREAKKTTTTTKTWTCAHSHPPWKRDHFFHFRCLLFFSPPFIFIVCYLQWNLARNSTIISTKFIEINKQITIKIVDTRISSGIFVRVWHCEYAEKSSVSLAIFVPPTSERSHTDYGYNLHGQIYNVHINLFGKWANLCQVSCEFIENIIPIKSR